MHSDWMMGLLGGLVIGLAGAMYLLINGRIMGASGILGGLVDRTGWGNWAERAAFVAGLIIAPGALALLIGGADTRLTPNLIVVVFAGFSDDGGHFVGADI